MSTILITGGCGFIGSNLVKQAIKEGFSVTVVDDMSNGHKEFLKNCSPSMYLMDFTTPQVLQAIEKKQFDVVVHLAALPRVSYSVEHPLETNDTNVTKTLKLMQSCVGNVKRFVFASSSSVYGDACTPIQSSLYSYVEMSPTSETTPKNPQSPYALQKSIIEDYLTVYKSLYDLDSASLRFFNVFGPNQLGDSPYSTAVGAWLSAIMKGRPMRSDGDGLQSRDMCYVDNVVNACIAAAKYPGQLNAERFNVACGESTTNRQILEFLCNRFPTSSYYNAPQRAGDVKHTLANVTKIERVLGVRPVVKFWEGLEKTIDWVQKTPEFLTLSLKV